MKTPGKVSSRGHPPAVFLLSGILIASPNLTADSVSIYPIADTSLFEYTPDNNFGAALSGGELSFDFFAQAGFVYSAECRDSPTAGDWVTFTNFPAQSVIRTITVTTPVSGSQRFYRLVMDPPAQ